MKRAFKYFLKLRFLPSAHLFFFDHETWGRLAALKQFLRKADSSRDNMIIDVGGGTGRLELAIKRTDIFILDQNPESIETARQNFSNAAVGSGSSLPFEDNSFDYAISIHTLEHVPQNERESFISEMVRISRKGIYLNFPATEFAAKLCRNYLECLRKKNLPENKWTVEHLEMGLPERNSIEKILLNQKKFNYRIFSYRNYRTENYYWTKIQVSKNPFIRYLATPLNSIIRFLYRWKPPSVELVIMGSLKDE